MGCLAGPVVVCAVRVSKEFYKKNHPALRGLRESKLLSAVQRDKFAEELMKEKNLVCAISQCSPKIIDKINIYQASRLAMRNAIKRINPSSNLQTIDLVDGNKKIPSLKS